MYTPEFLDVLDEYETRLARENALMAAGNPAELIPRRDEFLLAVGRETGDWLHTLAVGLKAQSILELGTSYGYSTLFLAQAARQTGGRVVTMELDAAKQVHARNMLARAGLENVVEWRTGDAIDLLGTSDDSFDLVLVDIWKELYLPCLQAVYPRLAARGVIVADNMISPAMHRSDARAYRAAVAALPDMETTLLPIGCGLEVSVRWPAGSEEL